MTFHKMLIAERGRELAAKVVACCGDARRQRPTPARHLRLPMASRTTTPACC